MATRRIKGGKHALRSPAKQRRMDAPGGRLVRLSVMLPVPVALAAPQSIMPPGEYVLAMSATPIASLSETVLTSRLALDPMKGLDPVVVQQDRDKARGSKEIQTGPRASVSEVAGHGPSSQVATNGIPAAAIRAYQRAEATMSIADPSCGLSWGLLAGIGRVESDHGRYGGAVLGRNGVSQPQIVGLPLNGVGPVAAIADTDGGQLDGDRRWDRAVGPMQFIPSTWAMVGVDGDQDGTRDPHDLDDAALAAAAYLCVGDEDLGTSAGAQEAVYSYNHSTDYVRTVMGVANAYEHGEFLPALAATGPGVTVGLGEPGRGVAVGGDGPKGEAGKQRDDLPGKHKKTGKDKRADAKGDDREKSTPPSRGQKPKHRGDKPTDHAQPKPPKADTGNGGRDPVVEAPRAPGVEEPTAPVVEPKPEPQPESPAPVERTENGVLVFCDETQSALCLEGLEDAPLAADVASYGDLVGQAVAVTYSSTDDGATWTLESVAPTAG